MTTMAPTAFRSILDGIAFFGGFSPEELDILLTVGKWSKVAPHERIIRQGDQDLHMFILVQGQAEVIYQEKVVAILHSGDIFGEIGLMGKPRIAHVESNVECMLLAFDANDLNQIPLILQVKLLKRILDTLFMRLQKYNVQKWLTTPNKSDKKRSVREQSDKTLPLNK